LAEILNVDRSFIAKCESGVNYPSVDRLILLCDYLKVTPDYLLGYDEKFTTVHSESRLYQDKELRVITKIKPGVLIIQSEIRDMEEK
jgi:transcriptional regulator with XRE-family HTH domain